MPAGPNPDIDTARIARIYAALADSPWADAAEREAVAQDAHPGTRAARERIRSARRYHAAAAVNAVTRGIRGIVFGAGGLPAEPEPHTAAAAACPDARFVFADADPIVAKISEALLRRLASPSARRPCATPAGCCRARRSRTCPGRCTCRRRWRCTSGLRTWPGNCCGTTAGCCPPARSCC